MQRPADPGEILVFLSDTVTELDVAAAVASSPAALAEPAAVIRIYEAVFGRKPDAGGLNYWVDRLANEPGFDLLKLAQGFVTSNEFRDRYGVSGLDDTASKKALIEALYKNVLDRQPDSAGLEFWIGTSYTPAQLLVFFSESREFIERAAPNIQQFFIDIAINGANDPSKSDSDDFSGSIFSAVQTDAPGDTGGPVGEVGDVNDRPTDIGLTRVSVAENAPGAIVGDLSTTDADADDKHTYTLVSNDLFEIVNNQLKLKSGVSVDHEKNTSVSVTIMSTDIGSASVQKTFAIAVTDVNEKPTDISLANASVAENAAGAVIGSLNTTDVDVVDSHSYTVDNASFEVVNGQLKLKEGISLDFEKAPSVDVKVASTDGGGLSVDKSFTITVTDVNEAPTAVVLSGSVTSTAENGGPIKVADLSATDDALGDEIYSVTGADLKSFEIRPGNELWFKGGANFEAKSTYSITINANDSTVGGDPDATTPFTLAITNVNEAPTAIVVTNQDTLPENTDVRTRIADLSVIDPDIGGSTRSFINNTLSVDDGRFEVTNGQLFLKAGQSINFEDGGTIGLKLTATDAADASLTYEQNLTITVTDVNEAPTAVVLSGSVTSTAENGGPIKVADLSATDDALGDEIYSVTGADFDSFEIRPGNELWFKGGANFEAKSTYSITINANDSTVGGDPDATTPFTLAITNVNEAPTAIVVTNQDTLPENTDVRTRIADLSVIDPDIGGSTRSFINNTLSVDDGRFEVTNGQLFLKAGQSINFEDGGTIGLKLTATDAADASLTYEQNLTITVTDVNEAPTAVVLSGSVTSTAENGGPIKVADLSATDDALGDEIYSVTGADFDSFEIRPGNELWFKGGANFEAKSTYSITINANDSTVGGDPDATTPFTLAITNVNEAPTAIVVTNQDTLPENTDVRTRIADLSVIDPDIGGSTRSFINNTLSVDDGRFEVTNGQLFLKAGQSINFEDGGTIGLKLTATDAADASLTYEQNLTITVTDVNEAPTAVVLSGSVTSTAENGGPIKVADLSATDDALGDEIYSVTGADFDSFEIRPGNELWFKGGANFEAKSTYSITINANDSTVGGDPDATTPFTLAITNVNEAPTAVVLSGSVTSTAENGGPIKVADLSATDDALGDEIYSITGADFDSFEIRPGNELWFKGGANFEAKSTYSITVNANDSTVGGDPDATTPFTLAITNVNERRQQLP